MKPSGYERVDQQRQSVSDQIVSLIESGELGEWVREWSGAFSPMNPVSGSEYTGMNKVGLAVIGAMRGYDDNRWCTFNQAKKMGYRIRKGAKSAVVERWRAFTQESKDVNPKTGEHDVYTYFKCVGYWSVFNFADMENVPELERHECVGDFSVADQLIETSRCPITESGDRAFYSPMLDSVTVPPRESFTAPQAFTLALTHEMAHSTKKVTGRTGGMFGGPKYAFEELVAELSSVFTCSELSVMTPANDTVKNNAAYLKSWMSACRSDEFTGTEFIYAAAIEASKATDYIVKCYNGQQ